MGFNVTDLTGPEIERLIAALEALGGLTAAIQALTPGLVTTTQRGLLGPDAEAIENGFIKLATGNNKGLMSAAFAALLEDPSKLLYNSVAAYNNPGFHNAIPRRKNLGSSFTANQIAAIQARTYLDMFPGDYWQKDGITHTIMHIEPHYRCGDNMSLGPHILVMSDGGWSSQWNATNDTSTGYVNSAVRAYIKSSGGPQEKIINFFGSGHVLSYRALYPTTYSSGNATGWAWTDARSELPNETQVYGHQVWGQNGYEDGIDKFQLAAFRFFPELMNTRAGWWLRSVYSATDACIVSGTGYASYHSASSSLGVRPLSIIA